MIGIRLGIIGSQGGGKSWASYWANQPEVLFFGLYSDIADGKMPNRKSGSSDYLTIAGAAGSETYQCPNTAPYIAADTDYIWFKTDETQRTVTTAELIGYDLQRTPVKYNDDAPNAIVAIIILNAAVTGTKRDYLFRDMWLPILWDNSLSAYGHVKDNRGATQQLWTPEVITYISDTFTDTNAVHLHDHTMDIGAGWTALTNWTISSNKLICTGTTSPAAYYAICESSHADVDITADFTIPDIASYAGGILFRYQDNTHCWIVIIERDAGGTPYVALSENGSVTRGTANITHDPITASLRVTCNGTAIKCYWKGDLLIEYTSSSYSTLTKHGIFGYTDSRTGDYYKAPVVDNFLIIQ